MRKEILELEQSVLNLDLKDNRRTDFNEKVVNYLNNFIDNLKDKKWV